MESSLNHKEPNENIPSDFNPQLCFSLCILSAKIHVWLSEWHSDDLETIFLSLLIILAAQLVQAIGLFCTNTDVDKKLWI